MSKYLCKECVHSRVGIIPRICSRLFEFKSPDSIWYECSRNYTAKSESQLDPVNGKLVSKAKDMPSCSAERKYGNCGIDAKYWTPKRKTDLFKYLAKETIND